MSDDPLDRKLRQMAQSARSEVERGVDESTVEAALSESTADGRLHVRVVPHRADRSAVPRWFTLGAAASVVAVAVGVAYMLLGRDDQISSQTPPSSQPAGPVVTAPIGTTVTPPVDTTAPATTPATTTAATIPATTTGVTGSTEATTTTLLLEDIAVIASIDEVPYERYLPVAQCLEDDCAQIAYDPAGAAWTFRNGVLTSHVRGGAVVPLPEPWRSVNVRDIGLIAIGPDDVAYFQVFRASESATLVGISVADGDAGQEMVVLDGAVDFSGDTDYVPTPAGLAMVGCCGADQIRPAPDADLLVEWLDRAGNDPPVPDITFDVGSIAITRDDLTWTFAVDPQRLMARGMPRVTPTHDGGVIGVLTGLDTGTGDSGNYVVRGWPDGSTSVAALSFELYVSALSPEGFVVMVADSAFVVADLFSDASQPDRVATTIDFESGTVTLDEGWPAGFDEPDERLARANAIAGATQLGERRTVDALDADAHLVVVTTEGFFDDSVFGARLTIDFTNETIGWAQTCQPDRGQQDYQPELCV
jgi:hypothetical protein